jgi:hypothetical protein
MQFAPLAAHFGMETPSLPCHPDRSEAKRRDLRFYGDFMETLVFISNTGTSIPEIRNHSAPYKGIRLKFVASQTSQKKSETRAITVAGAVKSQ